MVDQLPVGIYYTGNDGDKQFTRGFPVGFKTGTGKDTKHYLYNHVRIIISYHDDKNFHGEIEDESPSTKIVGFRVEPMSIKHSWDGPADKFTPGTTVLTTCNSISSAKHDPKNYYSVDKNTDALVVFTYDVVWEKSSTEWSQRWDVYLNAGSPNEKVHWFSITNSIMIVMFLSVMIAMILIRNLRKDIAQYNDPATIEEAKEESGWKLVHGDVFRPPVHYPMIFRLFLFLFFLVFSLFLFYVASRCSCFCFFFLVYLFR
jgi:transmembrane 9 superfamily protein 2/4